MAEILKQFGRLDILVNNAGVNTAKHRVNIDQFPLEEWDRILKIDLTGTFLVSQAATRIMLKQHEGRIINIASVLGVIPARLQCAFTAAKAGVVHLNSHAGDRVGRTRNSGELRCSRINSDGGHQAAFLQRKCDRKRSGQKSAEPHTARAGRQRGRNGSRCAFLRSAGEFLHHGANTVR